MTRHARSLLDDRQRWGRRVGQVLHNPSRRVDNLALSTESHRRNTRAGDHGAIPCGRTRGLYAGKTVLVPNPQHLLLTLFFETSMYEEKCRL